MRPRPRLRKTAKWAGVVVCAVIAAAYGLRLGFIVYYYTGEDTRTFVHLAAVSRGAFVYSSNLAPPATGAPRITCSLATNRYDPPWWTPRWQWDDPRSVLPRVLLVVPLWIPFLLFAFPTALLWRRDHILTRAIKRARAGRCPKCNYDR